MLLTVAALAFFDSWILHKNHVDIHASPRYQGCEAFIGRVLDGRQQATPDQFVRALQDQQWAMKAEGDMTDSFIDDSRYVGWVAAIAIVVQIAAGYKIWQRLHKVDA